MLYYLLSNNIFILFSGLLETLFEGALTANLISESSIKAWESTDEEEKGLGMCVTSVQTFIRNLPTRTTDTE